ncbi:MAG TPA: ABC transporter ATP-binding protein [Candidatus Acidoferrales bacterium]|nr:ABC transporter ATP-binding protein [Candidatus Acidoferrales bacterium]
MAIQEEEVLGKAYDSRIMRRLLRYLRPYTFQVVLAVAAILLKAGCDVLGPLLTKTAIDKYLTHATRGGPSFLNRALSSDPVRGISQIAFLYLLLLVVGFLLEYTQTYMMQWTGQKVMFDLRSHLYRHVQRMHLAFFDRNPVGRLVTRLTTDVDALNEMFTSGVVSIFEDIFVLVGIVIVMLKMSPRLALLTFLVLPFIMVATNVFRKAVRDGYRRIRTAIARINSYLQEHVSGIVPLQLFNREEISYREFEAVNAQHMQAFKDTILAYALYYPIVETLSVIAIANVIWFGGNEHLRGLVGLGTLVAFIQYSQRFFRPIQDLSEKYNILQGAMASSERIFKLLDTPPAIVSASEPQQPQGPGLIEFDHVWFAYRHVPLPEDPVTRKSPGPSDEWDWVLRDASFTIEPSQSVAIVGHTGAGKTTLISLLLRFYDVQKGSVRIDGVDVRDMDLQELRRRCGVVLQDPFLFSGTIADNIRLGTETVTMNDVERASREVNISEFIDSLPERYETPVVERGSTLSTGQKQLISFARALAHKPSILILDEATSSVDTETEFRVREALTRLVEGRTSLIIAHRLSTIQRADKIIVMHKGKVREQGTHQELLAQRGIYYKLYQLQYKDQELPTAPPASTLTPLPQPAGD